MNEEWKEAVGKAVSSTIAIDFAMAGPTPIYVVKVGPKTYLRWVTTGSVIGVERELATRFDSRTWAACVASQWQGAVVKRLKVRTRKKVTSSTRWVHSGKVEGAKAPEPESVAAEAPAPSEGNEP